MIRAAMFDGRRMAAQEKSGDRSWWSSIWAVVMALVLAVAGAVMSSSPAHALEGGYGDKFTAYLVPDYFPGGTLPSGKHSEFSSPLLVQDQSKFNTLDGAELVYCFNLSREFPYVRDREEVESIQELEEATWIRTKSAGSLDQWADNAKDVDGGIEQAVVRAIANSEAVGAHYGLEAWEVNMVTQRAVWHFTDSLDPDNLGNSSFTDAQNSAYKSLVGAGDDESPELIPADDYTLDIYEADDTIADTGKRFQNLLSTKVRDSDTFEEIGMPGDGTPQVTTFAYSQSEDDKLIPADGGTVNDKVVYSGLDTNKQYVVKGELMIRETGESTGITSQSEPFQPEAADGEITVSFNMSAEQAAALKGKTLVVFETLYEVGEGGVGGDGDEGQRRNRGGQAP